MVKKPFWNETRGNTESAVPLPCLSYKVCRTAILKGVMSCRILGESARQSIHSSARPSVHLAPEWLARYRRWGGEGESQANVQTDSSCILQAIPSFKAAAQNRPMLLLVLEYVWCRNCLFIPYCYGSVHSWMWTLFKHGGCLCEVVAINLRFSSRPTNVTS